METTMASFVVPANFVTLKQLQEQRLREKQVLGEAEEKLRKAQEAAVADEERGRKKRGEGEEKLGKPREAPMSYRRERRLDGASSKRGIAGEGNVPPDMRPRKDDPPIPILLADDRVDERRDGLDRKGPKEDDKKTKKEKKKWLKKKSKKAVAKEEVAQDVGCEEKPALKETGSVAPEPTPDDSASAKCESKGAPRQRSKRDYFPVKVRGGEPVDVVEIRMRIGDLAVDSGAVLACNGNGGKEVLERNRRKKTVRNEGWRDSSVRIRGMRRGGAATAGGGLVWVKKTPEPEA